MYPTPGENVNSGVNSQLCNRLANGQVHVRCRVLLEVEVAIAPVHPGGEKRKFASKHQKWSFLGNEKIWFPYRPGKGYFHQKGEWGGMSSLKFGRIDYRNVLFS